MRRLVLIGLLAAHLAIPAGATAATTCATAGSGFTTALKASNGRWVSVELGYSGPTYGMLRARATEIGPWERFYVHCLGGGQIALRSQANGAWVTAEMQYTGSSYGMLRARAARINAWERYTFESLDGAFATQPVVLISTANGREVSAELGYTGADNGMLRARGGTGPWEIYMPSLLDPPPPPPSPPASPRHKAIGLDAGLGCTPPGERLRVRLRVRRPPGGTRPSVRRVVFAIDHRVRRIDRRPPYVARLRVPFRAGTRHRLAVTVHYQIGGKPRKTIVRRRFGMCR
jgi:hypothetical protein